MCHGFSPQGEFWLDVLWRCEPNITILLALIRALIHVLQRSGRSPSHLKFRNLFWHLNCLEGQLLSVSLRAELLKQILLKDIYFPPFYLLLQGDGWRKEQWLLYPHHTNGYLVRKSVSAGPVSLSWKHVVHMYLCVCQPAYLSLFIHIYNLSTIYLSSFFIHSSLTIYPLLFICYLSSIPLSLIYHLLIIHTFILYQHL